jgi:hypothetical protein
MSVDWLSWSNPVSIWWGCLLLVSSINVILWLAVARHLLKKNLRLEVLACLSAVYVFGCAFRAVLPRADVQRICLFDNWLSSVLVGRSIATVAEVCFAAQWAVVLYCLADSAQSGTVRKIAKAIVPLIILAECCSWYAVITTDYLGNTVENSLWAATLLLIGAGLVVLLDKFEGVIQFAIRSALLGIVGYVAFMVMVDVPMYFERWQADAASGKELLGLIAGLQDAGARWIVTRNLARWQGEITWMTLYFSLAVWASLGLCWFALVKNVLHRYRKPTVRLTPGLRAYQPISVRVDSR